MSTYYAAQFGIALSIIELSTAENVIIYKSSLSKKTDYNKSGVLSADNAAPNGVRKRGSGSVTK
jgi:hypothetical protein